MRAFTIIRVSAQDQLKGYGPDVQWEDDVLLNAPSLGLEPSVEYRRIIQEPATGWDRELFASAVREGLALYFKGEVDAMLFPRVDRETRFVIGSVGLLSEVLRNGMPVFFARDKFSLDPSNPESVERYLNKAIQAQTYVATMRENVMRATRKRAEKDHRMPTGGDKWAYDYHHYRKYQQPDANSGGYTVNPERAVWVKKWKDWILYEGLKLKEVERRFESLSGIKLNRATLLRVLTDPIVIGKVYAYRHKVVIDSQGRKRRVPVPESDWLLVYEDPSLAIFSEDEYYALKRKFQLNKQNSPRNTKYNYPPLKGKVHCLPCGLKMPALTTNFGTAYYRCPRCRNHANAWRMWNKIKVCLIDFLLDPGTLVRTIKANFDNGQTRARLERELRELECEKEGWQQSRVKQRRLYLLPNGNYSERDYLRDDERIQSQIQGLNDRITQLNQQIAEVRQLELDEEGIRRFCQTATRNFIKMTSSEWQLLLEAMHLKVTVFGKSFDIEGVVPISNGDIVLQPARR